MSWGERLSSLRASDDYHRGFRDGYKEGLRLAMEQQKDLIAMQTRPILITVGKSEYDKLLVEVRK